MMDGRKEIKGGEGPLYVFYDTRWMKRSDLVDVTLKNLGENVYFSSFRAVSNCGNGVHERQRVRVMCVCQLNLDPSKRTLPVSYVLSYM